MPRTIRQPSEHWVPSWDAMQVLQLEPTSTTYAFNCVGETNRGRRCGCQIAKRNVDHAEYILKQLPRRSLDMDALEEDLEAIAYRLLCVRFHRDRQVEEMVDRWLPMVLAENARLEAIWERRQAVQRRPRTERTEHEVEAESRTRPSPVRIVARRPATPIEPVRTVPSAVQVVARSTTPIEPVRSMAESRTGLSPAQVVARPTTPTQSVRTVPSPVQVVARTPTPIESVRSMAESRTQPSAVQVVARPRPTTPNEPVRTMASSIISSGDESRLDGNTASAASDSSDGGGSPEPPSSRLPARRSTTSPPPADSPDDAAASISTSESQFERRRREQLEEKTCPICIDNFTDPCETLCGHIFCLGCATEWLSSNTSCPSCRQPAARYHLQLLSNWRSLVGIS